jgi:signal transduction histidine kinase/ActR/RegA family two-component response regulator
MDKSSLIFKRGFSLRQAFAVTNLVILTVGTAFTVIILGSQELSVSGSRVDAIFDEAHDAVRSIVIGIPLMFKRPLADQVDWIKAQADLLLPRDPALYDLYFGYSERGSQRYFKLGRMGFSVSRNISLYSTPGFNAPATFREITYDNQSTPDGRDELWFQGALRTEGVFRTPFYYDVTYFKRVMISFTAAVRDPKTNEAIGVAGVDLTAGRVSKLLAAQPIGKTGGVFLTDADGKPMAPFLGRDVPLLGYQYDPASETSPAYLSVPPKAPTFRCLETTQQVMGPDGKSYLYQGHALRETGFCVIAFQQKTEAYASLYWVVGLMTAFSAFVLFTSLFFRQALARFVIDNIRKILENINLNREHFTEAEMGKEYLRLEPEGPREIARIAHQLNLLYQRLQLSFSEVRDEKDRAELATKTKSRFLSVMSHEIRTPLNAMLGLTDVLLLSPLSSEQIRHLQVLQRSGQTLLRILNDILDFSRLEAGKLFIETHEFNLYELLYDIESLMRFDAEAKGLHFHIVAPSHDYRLSGDSIRIRQALLNLVGNAIKFTGQGAIDVRVTLIQDDAPDSQRFQFEVADSGIGMSPDQQGKVFSEFAQADASITRRYGGTGLGLSISRHIIELLGGKISIQSEQGKGSIFQFTIPLKIVAQRKAHYQETPTQLNTKSLTRDPLSTSVRLQKLDTRVRIPEVRFEEGPTWAETRPQEVSPNAPAILIVDDDEDNHRLIAAYMKFRRDLRAVHVFSAKEALLKIRAEAFALVVMDMQMPEVDGLDATQEIRRLEREGVIARRPVVMLSANTFAEDREKSLKAGADEHLPKPIKLDQFKDMLKRWIPTP